MLESLERSEPNQSEIPQTQDQELNRILEQQQVEQKWWGNQPAMETADDTAREVENGKAVVVPDEGIGYKISAKVKPEFRVLEKNTYSLLKSVAEKWLEKAGASGADTSNLFLVVSSLARTQEFQRELIKQGYPAAENSTHVKLGAFDIATRWLEENKPELLEILTSILQELQQQGEANFIEEPTIGAHHVAFNRTKVH
jgi:hypothetical protein